MNPLSPNSLSERFLSVVEGKRRTMRFRHARTPLRKIRHCNESKGLIRYKCRIIVNSACGAPFVDKRPYSASAIKHIESLITYFLLDKSYFIHIYAKFTIARYKLFQTNPHTFNRNLEFNVSFSRRMTLIIDSIA